MLALSGSGAPDLFAGDFDRVITPDRLSLDCLVDMRFRYSTAELCFALKPWAMRHLLAAQPEAPVYYVDSDIEILSPLDEVAAALTGGADVVLTPHIIAPAEGSPAEIALLQSGVYNGGFVAVAPTQGGRAFLAWWGERLKADGTLEVTCGDQKWLELAPALFDRIAVLRHPGYNFALWNAAQRPLRRAGGGWTAAGAPLRFVHYTKWTVREEAAGDYLAAYFRPEDWPPLVELFAAYREAVLAAHRAEDDVQPAHPALLCASGEPIPDLVRRIYAGEAPTTAGDEAAVLAASLAVLNGPSRRHVAGAPALTVLYDGIWERQPELRHAFDINSIAGRRDYLRWLSERGGVALSLPEAFLAPAREQLGEGAARPMEWLSAMTVGAAGERGPDGVAARPGKSGHLVYGPYVRLDPGDYRVRICWRATPPRRMPARDPIAMAIEVVSRDGGLYLAERKLRAAECAAAEHELDFRVGPPPIWPIEVRIWTGGAVPVVIASVAVQPLSAGAAPE